MPGQSTIEQVETQRVLLGDEGSRWRQRTPASPGRMPVVAMTGSQPTVLLSSKLTDVVLGVGVDPDHCRVLEAHPKRIDEMTEVMRAEIEHRGLSVVVAHREYVVSARKRKRGTR